ncbi:histidine phosphatase family protein [Parvularcula lutaonensis]|uniref:Histidine phosphatase family protein n=1 Tax=Parvularcula lutaonensis TaxID=491923 RepID=A0ABV7MDK2_9PROT|nr:histidine phosphatase family protein [Parvularcula lutaonensis]GGY40843.1 phosphoglycerate mutase [Parvularcula lutaonensis]
MTDGSELPLTGRRRLYLLRHGHVDYFAPGLEDFTQVPLTEEGRSQAALAGKALAGVRFDAAFNSGLPRTAETLSIVLDQQDSALQPVSIEGFAEIRGGKVKVETPEELCARLAFSFDGADEEGASFLPGGELFADAEARIVDAYQSLITDHAWKTGILVAHEGVNRILLAHLTGGGLGALGHFEQDLCGINVLDFDVVPSGEGVEVERVILKAVNLTVHDPIKERLPRTSLEHLFGIDFGGARPRKGL